MSAEVLIANLLRVAREDLDGANLLGAAGNRNAIYLCEQAAEKIIRAIEDFKEIAGNVERVLEGALKGFAVDVKQKGLPAGNPRPLR